MAGIVDSYPGGFSFKQSLDARAAGYNQARAQVEDGQKDTDRMRAEQQRGVMENAGRMVAGGNLKGARGALYGAGNFEGGARIDQMLRQADDDQLAKAKRRGEVFGNLALYADTPEKWAQALAVAKQRGVNTAGYEDFARREFVIAEHGMTAQQIAIEEARRKAEADKFRTVGKDARIFNETDGTFIAPPGSPAGGDVSDVNAHLPPDLRKKLAEKDAAALSKYGEEAQKAGEQLAAIDRLEAARAKTNWEGSGLNNSLTRWVGRNIGGGFGVIPSSEDVNALDEIEKASGDIALDRTSMLPGVASDSDTALILSVGADGNTKDDVAAWVIPAKRIANQRLQIRAEMYDEWLQTHGSARGFQEAWKSYVDGNKIFVQGRNGKQMVNANANPDWRPYLMRARQQAAQPAQSGARDFRSSIRAPQQPNFGAGAGNARTLSSDELFAIATGKK